MYGKYIRLGFKVFCLCLGTLNFPGSCLDVFLDFLFAISLFFLLFLDFRIRFIKCRSPFREGLAQLALAMTRSDGWSQYPKIRIERNGPVAQY